MWKEANVADFKMKTHIFLWKSGEITKTLGRSILSQEW
jgi:hypothetical protein